MLSSLSDETPEGRSIVELARERYGLQLEAPVNTEFVPFTAQTRMSGVDLANGTGGGTATATHSIRKGAADSVISYVAEQGGSGSPELKELVDSIARAGSTPLVVAETGNGHG